MFGAVLMVVFGAGASHDSLADYPPWAEKYQEFHELSMPYYELEQRRPPLAAQLFDKRFAGLFPRYRECLGLFPQLRRAARSRGIEQTLAELVEQSTDDFVIRQQVLALRFYLKDVITSIANPWLESTRGADNYAELLDHIDHWRRRTGQQVALVTFNYDALLDQALATMPYMPRGFSGMGDYISHDEYKLLKLHGSTDWLRLVEGLERKRDDSYEDVIMFARDHQIPTEADIVTATEAASMGKRWADVPAIAIPVQKKSTFEAPKAHLEMLAKCIDATTDVIVIGWRGMEAHFLELWHARTPPEYAPSGPPHLKRVLIVDKGEGSQVVETQLRTVSLMEASIESVTNGFTGLIRGDRLDTFLSGVLQMPERARVT